MDRSLVILLAAGTVFSFWRLLRRREELGMAWPMAAILAIAHTIVGVISVKVFAVLETLDFSKAGSMSLFGGVFFMPLLYLLGAKLFRRKTAAVCDAFTPCMVFTVMCARINCIISGCCLGLMLPGGSGLRWPTRELEIVFYIVLLAWFFRREKRDGIPGELYPIYMMTYGAARFFLEFFRESSSLGIIHVSHIWAAIAFCLGLSVYTELRKNMRRKKKNA